MRWRRSILALALCALAGAATAVGPAKDAGAPTGRLQRVEDHIAIERVLMEYGRALGSQDFTACSQLFAVQGEWSGSIGTVREPAAVRAAMEEAFQGSRAAQLPTNFHLLTNAINDVHGDRATAWSKWSSRSIAARKGCIRIR